VADKPSEQAANTCRRCPFVFLLWLLADSWCWFVVREE
jgi:hypothetical protein